MGVAAGCTPNSWPGPSLNLQVWALKALRRMLGGITTVEGFGLSPWVTCLRGPLIPTLLGRA